MPQEGSILLSLKEVLIVKVGELHLKGQNRPFFERALLQNIREALPMPGKVHISQSRIYVEDLPEGSLPACIDRLRHVFGVYALSPARETDKNLPDMAKAVLYFLQDAPAGKSFRIKARRADKRFPMTSPEIAAQIGGLVLAERPDLTVDLHKPDIVIEVEVRERAYAYGEQIPAVGGMPVGTAGKAMLLLSGGIDSPVAGYMMAKRGLVLEAVHFYSFPHTTERAKEKVLHLAKLLTRSCRAIRVHVVPFTEIQETLYTKCPERFLTILMRRAMMQISESIARAQGCGALITGESLGQVASQTLEALHATDSAVTLPVFRPVIGFDKTEIMERAQTIGTYETSILPYEDCCTVFTPRHPATHPKLEDVLAAEEKLDKEMLSRAVANTESIFLPANAYEEGI